MKQPEENKAKKNKSEALELDNINTDSKKLAEENMQALILQHDDFKKLKAVLEALLFASDKALSIKQISSILIEHNEDANTRVKDKVKFNKKYINLAIDELATDYENNSVEIKLIGTGYRIQTKPGYIQPVICLQYLYF